MHIKKMTFGFGVITGAAAALFPLFLCRCRMNKTADDQENHESTEVSQKQDFKDKVMGDASKISKSMKKEVDKLIASVEDFNPDGLKAKGKESFNAVKQKARSLKKMAG